MTHRQDLNYGDRRSENLHIWNSFSQSRGHLIISERLLEQMMVWNVRRNDTKPKFIRFFEMSQYLVNTGHVRDVLVNNWSNDDYDNKERRVNKILKRSSSRLTTTIAFAPCVKGKHLRESSFS